MRATLLLLLWAAGAMAQAPTPGTTWWPLVNDSLLPPAGGGTPVGMAAVRRIDVAGIPPFVWIARPIGPISVPIGTCETLVVDVPLLRSQASNPAYPLPGNATLYVWTAAGPCCARSVALRAAVEVWNASAPVNGWYPLPYPNLTGAVPRPVAWYRYVHSLVNVSLQSGGLYWFSLVTDQQRYQLGALDWLAVLPPPSIPFPFRWEDAYGNFLGTGNTPPGYTSFTTAPLGTPPYSSNRSTPLTVLGMRAWAGACSNAGPLVYLPAPNAWDAQPPGPAPSPISPAPAPAPTVQPATATPGSGPSGSGPAASTAPSPPPPLGPVSPLSASSYPSQAPPPFLPTATYVVAIETPTPTWLSNGSVVPPQEKTSLGPAVTIGVVLAGLLLLALIGVVIYMVVQRRRHAEGRSQAEYERTALHPDDRQLVELEEVQARHEAAHELADEAGTPHPTTAKTPPLGGTSTPPHVMTNVSLDAPAATLYTDRDPSTAGKSNGSVGEAKELKR